MRRANNFEKKIFTDFDIVQNFHLFCQVRPCRFYVKHSGCASRFSVKIFKFPKIALNCVEALLLTSRTNNFAENICFTDFEIVTKFSPFLSGRRLSIFRPKFKIFQNYMNLYENTSFDEKSKSFCRKLLSLQTFVTVQICIIFVRSVSVYFPSKIQVSPNCLKLCRNTSFDEKSK